MTLSPGESFAWSSKSWMFEKQCRVCDRLCIKLIELSKYAWPSRVRNRFIKFTLSRRCKRSKNVLNCGIISWMLNSIRREYSKKLVIKFSEFAGSFWVLLLLLMSGNGHRKGWSSGICSRRCSKSSCTARGEFSNWSLWFF